LPSAAAGGTPAISIIMPEREKGNAKKRSYADLNRDRWIQNPEC
jgi:hypothetical protein